MKNKQARVSGVLYLLLAVIAPFSMMYVPSLINTGGDITATTGKILENEFLFRAGIVGDSFVVLIEIVLSVFIYRLFKPVNQSLAQIVLSSRIAMTIIQGVNIILSLMTLELAINQEVGTALGASGSNGLASLLLKGHGYGVFTWQIFFGLHLIALGYLALKSGYLPKIFGRLIMAASLGYLFGSYTAILAPTNEILLTVTPILLVVSTIGEIAFTLWLMIKGLNSPVNDFNKNWKVSNNDNQNLLREHSPS